MAQVCDMLIDYLILRIHLAGGYAGIVASTTAQMRGKVLVLLA
jgi:hypothetical protein